MNIPPVALCGFLSGSLCNFSVVLRGFLSGSLCNSQWLSVDFSVVLRVISLWFSV